MRENADAAGGDRVDEATLIARARDGDRAAQDRLVRRYTDEVYRTVYRLLGDADLAQDATQDAFINALHGLARFRGDASFRTWLLRIAVNAAHSIGRRRTRRREVNLDAAAAEPAQGRGADEAAARKSEQERLQRLLERLPPKQRMAVVLRAQNGLDYAEIGRALDCSEGAARVNYHLGIKRLKELAGE